MKYDPGADFCQDLRAHPKPLGRNYLYNRTTGQYCAVGFALRKAGVPLTEILDAIDDSHAVTMAANLYDGTNEDFWNKIMTCNDDYDGHGFRSRKAAVLNVAGCTA